MINPLSLKQMLDALPEPLEVVLTKTYGLLGTDRQPLDRVANELSLSPDEVEIYCTKGIRLLRDPRLLPLAPWTNQEIEEETWRQMSDSRQLFVMRAALAQTTAERLDGELEVEILKRYGSVNACLSQIALATESSWVRPEHELDEIKNAIDSLTELIEKRGLPRPVQSLVAQSGITRELLIEAVHLSSHFSTGGQYGFHANYVIDSPTGARSIRNVRLHQLMCRYSPNTAIATRQLIELYREHHTDDDFDSLAAYTSMRSAHFLFQRTSHNYWICIHPEAHIENELRETDLEFGSIFFKTGRDEVSVRSMVFSTLQERGMVTDKELQTAFLIQSNGKYRGSQLGNIFNTNCEIIYLAPDLLGLEEMLPDLLTQEQSYSKLLNQEACKCFIAARAAGEPRELYPLWTLTMEYRWCCWAKDHLPTKDFEGLLFVCEPEKWSVDKQEKAQWIGMKQSMGRYSPSRKPTYYLDKVAPPLKYLFRVAFEAKTSGDISWVGTNWVTKRKLTKSARASTVLAYLVALDVLGQVEHWCLRHPVGDNIDDFIHRLNSELYLTGSLEWNSPLGLEILEKLRKAEFRTDLKLLTADQIHSFTLSIEQQIGVTSQGTDHPAPPVDVSTSRHEPDSADSGAPMEQLSLFS